MPKTITLKIDGDARGLEQAAAAAVKSIERLEAASKRLSGGSSVPSSFAGINTLSSQQMAEVERLSKMRQSAAAQDARVINQHKLSEVRAAELAYKSQINAGNNASKAQIAAANNLSKEQIAAANRASKAEIADANNTAKAVEAAKKREFSEFQRLEKEKSKIAAAEARKRESSNIGKTLQSAGGGIRNAGIATSAVVTAPIVGFAIQASKAATESADAIGQVDARIKSMGNAAQRSSEQLKQSATELMHISTFDDDDILRNVTAALLTFGNVAGEQFDRGQLAAVNMSTALGTDLQSATLQIGKALNDPIKGITALSRAGVSFTEQQKDQIKTLVASGKSVEAQKIILGELEREFGGAAQAARDNDPFADLRNSSDDFSENVGKILNDTLPKILTFVSSYLEAFNQLPESTQTTIVAIAGIAAAIGPVLIVVGSLVGAIGTLVEAFGAVSAFLGFGAAATTAAEGIAATGVEAAAATTGIGALATSLAPVIAVIAALAAAAGVLYLAWQTNFGGIQEFVGGVIERINGLISDFISFLSSADVSAFTSSLQQAFDQAAAVVGPAIAQMSADVNDGFQQILAFFDANGADLKAAAMQIFKFLGAVVKAQFDGIRVFWAVNGAQITAIAKSTWEIIKAVVGGGVRTVGAIIKLVAAVINGDWAKAWAAFKNIGQIGMNAALAILKGLGSILLNIMKAALAQGFALGGFIAQKTVEIGKWIIEGLRNGIQNGAAALYNTISDVVGQAMSLFSSIPKVQSPSKVTTEIGEYISEGLAVGIENKKSAAVAAARKVSNEVIKAFKDAQKEFSKLAGASPETVRTIQQTNRVSDAASSQSEIIKLRGELKVNQYQPLPSTVQGTETELADLSRKKQAQDDFNKSLDDMRQLSLDADDALQQWNDNFDERLKNLQSSGEIELFNLQQEIALTGVKDQAQRQDITNLYEILRLREQMTNDGYSENQIAQEVEIIRLQQLQQKELQGILEVRKQVAGATDLQKNLEDQLLQSQNGGKELSEYEKTLRKINEDFKDISPAQAAQLLNTAAQIDAQKTYNEQYKKTYDFVRGSLDILTEKGTSFGDKLKKIFSGVFQNFKKMLLDMAAQKITGGLLGGGSNSGQSGGGLLGNLFKGIFGGGSSSGGNTFGGGNSGGSVSAGGGLSIGAGTGNIAETIGLRGGGTISSASGASNPLTGLLSGQGISSAIASGGVTAAIALAQYALTTKSPIKGLLTGGLVGLAAGFINRSKLRKKEEVLRTQYLSDATASIAQFDKLIMDVRSLHTDPTSALASGESLAKSIRDQYLASANSLTDKKTRNIALSEVSRLDSQIADKMAQLKSAANKAQSVKDLDGHIIGEFAGGNFFRGRDDQMAEMMKMLDTRRGFIAGGQLGVDRHLGLFADGEMILNQKHQLEINRAAGFDVLAHAEVPNYPRPKPLAKYADGASFGTISSFSPTATAAEPPTFNFTFEHSIDAHGLVSTALKNSDEVKKQVKVVIEDKYKNGELKLRTR